MIYWIFHDLVASIFLRAGIGKYLGRRDFYWQLRASAGLNRRLAAVASYVIPGLELCVGIGFLMPVVGEISAGFLAAAMLLVFTGYALWITVTGRKIRCFCFGRDDGEIGWATVLRNSLLLFAVALAAFSPAVRISMEAALLSLIDGLTASLLFVGVFQILAMRKEFAKP